MDKQEKELEETLGMLHKAHMPSSERNNRAQMRQNENLKSRQIPQKPKRTEQTVRVSNQTAYKGQPRSSKGRNLSPKRKASIKRRKIQKIAFDSFLAILLIVLIIVLICKESAGGEKRPLCFTGNLVL